MYGSTCPTAAGVSISNNLAPVCEVDLIIIAPAVPLLTPCMPLTLVEPAVKIPCVPEVAVKPAEVFVPTAPLAAILVTVKNLVDPVTVPALGPVIPSLITVPLASVPVTVKVTAEMLTPEEHKLYIEIKEAEFNEDYKTVQKGLSKFSRMNAAAYMTLLD